MGYEPQTMLRTPYPPPPPHPASPDNNGNDNENNYVIIGGVFSRGGGVAVSLTNVDSDDDNRDSEEDYIVE